jgi:putative transposase
VDNGYRILAKIGRLKVQWSRPVEGTPKTVTITREADGWYMSISYAQVPTQPLSPTGQETGIDLGIEALATLANGERIHSPACYRKAECYLAKCAKRVARRKKGSHRRKKAVAILAKAHQTVARQRRDFHHQTALALVRYYDVLSHEDVPVGKSLRSIPPLPHK